MFSLLESNGVLFLFLFDQVPESFSDEERPMGGLRGGRTGLWRPLLPSVGTAASQLSRDPMGSACSRAGWVDRQEHLMLSEVGAAGRCQPL